MSVPDLNFRFLNRDGHWLDFTWDGLELAADGTLTLASLPVLTGDSRPVAAMPDPTGPAGIADGGQGIIYYSLADENRVNGVEACEPLAAPRGLAFPIQRRALFICDTGNHRVVIVDPDTSGVLEIWDGFDAPVGIAVVAGIVFIADRGSKRIAKLSLRGDADEAFADAVAASGLIADPVAIAAERDYVYVLDATKLAVCLFDHAGNPVPGPAAWAPLARPMGLAVTPDSIYVGDNALRRVLRFRNAPGYPFVGEAAGYEGPVAALAIARNGNLLIHTGAAVTPIVAIKTTGAFATSALLLSKALHVGAGQVAWHSLHATTNELPARAHIQFFFRTSDNPAQLPFPSPDWTAAPRDVTDLYLGGPPARFLWIVASFSSDGLGSPALTELKARFDQNTYFPLLPALYNYPTPSREFFGRLLALFESFNVDDEDAIARLPELFDPDAIAPPALAWLASWLAAVLDQHWSVAKQRQAIAQAYARDARRGTVAGLREAIAFETGQTVVIEEPIQGAAWWALPASTPPCGMVVQDGTHGESMLGIGTALAGPSPDGAVIGSTAILDRSRILNAEDFGLPLFDEVAHRFCVFLYRGAQSAQAQAIANVVDREKPAHTSYHLCTIEPRMRVGFQARVGIDTVVGGPPAPSALGEAASADGFALSSANGIRIGVHSRIGDRLRI